MYKQPTLKDYFREKQEVVVVKREYRRKYKINWKRFLQNAFNIFAFWRPPKKRYILLPSIELNHDVKSEFIVREDIALELNKKD